jgi:hypothetical protein
MSAEKTYGRFHGHKPDLLYDVKFIQPKTLVLLGEAVEIVYRSDKSAGGGNGKAQYYKHRFKKGTFLAADSRGKNQLYIIGDAIKISSAGIIG